MSDKTYWVGDDRDNQSVCIKREIYVKGDPIPAEDVAQELLDEWKKNGLIAVGDESAPVVIIDTEAVKNLKTEISVLKRDLERVPGLEREISDLKKAAEKAKGGSKAKAVKDLKDAAKVKDTEISNLKAEVKTKDDRIKDLEDETKASDLDVQEKAALIDKLNADIEALTKPEDVGAGPGGD